MAIMQRRRTGRPAMLRSVIMDGPEMPLQSAQVTVTSQNIFDTNLF